MTLIIGIHCEDGVVLGADGCNTGRLNRREYPKKLEIHHSRGVLGVAGDIGMVQRLSDRFKTLTVEPEANSDESVQPPQNGGPGDAVRRVQNSFTEVFVEERLRYQSLHDHQGAWEDTHYSRAQAIGCVVLQGGPCLFQIQYIGSPASYSSDQLPFATIGSGADMADPFLEFLKRSYMRGKRLNLERGILLAIWAMHHAIETNNGGVGHPIQLVTISNRGGNWEPREVPKEEFDLQFQSVIDLERQIASLRMTTEHDAIPIFEEKP